MLSTLTLFYIGDGIAKYLLHQRMVQYAIASAREDGTENRIVMIGKSGYLGYSSVRLYYMEDGWIRLTGTNVEEDKGWKLVAQFVLEPGRYTFTGMKDVEENVIALQLHISDDTGFSRYIYQWDEDVSFTIEQTADATLHVMVYPKVDSVDVKARPAVYRDE